MAVAKKTLKEKKTAGTGRTGKKTARRGNSSRRTKTQAKAGQETAALPQDENLDGEQILLDAVNREVADKSSRIATQLANQAAQGNSTSTKLVMKMLADRKTKSGKRAKRAGPTLAEQFIMERDWIDPETATEAGEQAQGNTQAIHG